MNEQIFEVPGQIFASGRATARPVAPASAAVPDEEQGSANRAAGPRRLPQPASAAAPRKRPGALIRMPAR
jgi:hypothetical protein